MFLLAGVGKSKSGNPSSSHGSTTPSLFASPALYEYSLTLGATTKSTNMSSANMAQLEATSKRKESPTATPPIGWMDMDMDMQKDMMK